MVLQVVPHVQLDRHHLLFECSNDFVDFDLLHRIVDSAHAVPKQGRHHLLFEGLGFGMQGGTEERASERERERKRERERERERERKLNKSSVFGDPADPVRTDGYRGTSLRA